MRRLVTGNLGDQNREFHFKVMLSDTGLNEKYLWTGNDEGDIISQYICFCNITNDKNNEHIINIKSKNTEYKDALKKAAEETVKTCIQKDILKEFMIKRKKVITALSVLFSEEYERKMREIDAEARGKASAFEAVPNILDGILDGLSDDDISSKYNIDVKSVQQIRARMNR